MRTERDKARRVPRVDPAGTLIAAAVIGCWGALMALVLSHDAGWTSPVSWLGTLALTHLYTGLFITAHDAMHGTVSASRRWNGLVGRLCATLFLFNSYERLRPKHFLHHRHPASGEDPDYHKGDPAFFAWYLAFLREYVTVRQIVLVAIAFNLLALRFPDANLILAVVVAPVLSTLQLFLFGTYLPHRGEHAEADVHRARSARRHHLAAFLACYFFGYHHEHHASPGTPWWRLWRAR